MTRKRHEVEMPRRAMMLAAGYGKRMRPITETVPKPLVRLAGKPLMEYGLELLDSAVVERVVVNVHYLADQIVAHLKKRGRPGIRISDERGELLDTGGGIARALPLIGARPFFLINADTAWRDYRTPALYRLAETFDAENMDALLLLADPSRAIGYDGAGDFIADEHGRLRRPRKGGEGGEKKSETGAYAYMGVAILHPRLFRTAPSGAFSLNLLFDEAIAAGRLFGIVHDGHWMHVGTPEALAEAEEFLAGPGA